MINITFFFHFSDSNLLDWGSRNKIAVAIEEKVYAWNVDNSACQPVCTANSDNGEPINIKSLAWDPRGKLLAMGTETGNIWVSRM